MNPKAIPKGIPKMSVNPAPKKRSDLELDPLFTMFAAGQPLPDIIDFTSKMVPKPCPNR